MKYFLLLISLFSYTFCLSQNTEDYFIKLDKEFSINSQNKESLKSSVKREEEKYEDEDSEFSQISYLFAKLLYETKTGDFSKNIAAANNLLRANKGKYKYIDIFSYYILSQNYPKYSYSISKKYMETAIMISKSTPQKYLLGHLYSYKAGYLLAEKNYPEAEKYYNLSHDCFLKEKNYLYASSQYNNIASLLNDQKKIYEAVEKTKEAIEILNKQSVKGDSEKNLLNQMKTNLGLYFLEIKEYQSAEDILDEVLEFYKKEKLYNKIVETSNYMIKILVITEKKEKLKKIITQLEYINSQFITDNKYKIYIAKILLNYYQTQKNLEKSKYYSEKIVDYNHALEEENQEKIKVISDIAHKSIIENINEKSNVELQNAKRKKNLVIASIIFTLFFLGYILEFYFTKRKKDAEIEILNQEKVEATKELLEQQVKSQEERIKNLHLNLNIKKETEEAFLEKIKKVRKSKTNDTEKILRELFVDMKNIANIDKKNFNFEIESERGGKCFKLALAEKFPNLTEQELQLCTYFRLGLSAKEISHLEKITDGSVRVYKSKIKTKMGLTKEDNLDLFLKKI